MDFFHSEAFTARVRELMNQHHVPGVSIAVVQDDKTASAGYGYASLEPSKPCTADTLFDIASSSKSLTAAAVGLLVEDDEKYPEVQYEATVSGLLPEDFVLSKQEYTDSVTIDDILSHRTGMPLHCYAFMGPKAAHPDDALSVTRSLRNMPIAYPIRSRYIYSDIGYIVATHLIEVKTGQNFPDFLEERFFQPLGMDSTSLQPTAARAKGFGDRIAPGYLWDKKHSTYREITGPDCPEGQGAGSIITSANDCIKWVKALMRHEGPVSDKVYHDLVRLRSFCQNGGRMSKPYRSPDFYAAGLEVYYYRGYEVVGHDGAIPGFRSRFFWVPKIKFGGVILGNSDGAFSFGNILTLQLIDAAIGILRAEPPVIKSDVPLRPQSQVQDSVIQSPKAIDEKEEESDGSDEDEDEEQAALVAMVDTAQAQVTPLNAYTGRYWHPGYHTIVVEVKDEKLFVDATDRSLEFTLHFDHVSDQTKYIAHMYDPYYEDWVFHLKAEFEFEEDRAVRLGLDFEESLKELIWFEREKTSSRDA